MTEITLSHEQVEVIAAATEEIRIRDPFRVYFSVRSDDRVVEISNIVAGPG